MAVTLKSILTDLATILRNLKKDGDRPKTKKLVEEKLARLTELAEQLGSAITVESGKNSDQDSLDRLTATVEKFYTDLEEARTRLKNTPIVDGQQNITEIQNNIMDYQKVVKLVAQIVPVFSGEDRARASHELQLFLGGCKQVALCSNSEEKKLLAQMVQSKLRGDAYDIVVNSEVTNLDELEAILTRTFMPRETYQELVNKLISCRQYPLESLSTYVIRLKQLLGQCREAGAAKYPSAVESTRAQLEDFAISALRTGLTNPLLCQYLLGIPTQGETFDTMSNKALDMERQQQSVPFMNPYQPLFHNGLFNLMPNNPIHPMTTPAEMNRAHPMLPYYSMMTQTPIPPMFAPPTTPPQLHTMTSSTERNLPQLPPPYYQIMPSNPVPTPVPPTPSAAPPTASAPIHTQESLQEDIPCSFCKKPGHLYDECRVRRNTPYCVYCKMHNHDVRDCRRKNRNSDNSETDNSNQNRRNNGGQQRQNSGTPCNFCSKQGHDEPACFQKKRWLESQSGNGTGSATNSPNRS